MSENNPTFRLFKKMPSFINGLSASIDFFGDDEKNYKTNETEKEADWNSIYSDWKAVGNDMSNAMKTYVTKRE